MGHDAACPIHFTKEDLQNHVWDGEGFNEEANFFDAAEGLLPVMDGLRMRSTKKPLRSSLISERRRWSYWLVRTGQISRRTLGGLRGAPTELMVLKPRFSSQSRHINQYTYMSLLVSQPRNSYCITRKSASSPQALYFIHTQERRTDSRMPQKRKNFSREPSFQKQWSFGSKHFHQALKILNYVDTHWKMATPIVSLNSQLCSVRSFVH